MTDTKSNAALSLIQNALSRSFAGMFPSYFPEAKHNHYKDFGWPTSLTFSQLHSTYSRNGMAAAGVDKTRGKTWETNPVLREVEDEDETALEADIRKKFAELRFWQALGEADTRSMVGGYSGVILRMADGKAFDQPAGRVNGLDGLVGVIPAWAGQLAVSEWHSDPQAPEYGTPKMFQFQEANVSSSTEQSGGQNRSLTIHPDRVVVWSKDGTVNCNSILKAGYNDLLTMEKVSGAGGEGFWKNAKNAPVLEMDKDTKLQDMLSSMGLKDSEELLDAIDGQVEGYNKGFDKSLLLQNMKATTLAVTLPSPEHFYAIAEKAYAASIGIPVKVLDGNQTGERASTEDQAQWAKTNMSRRENLAIPNVMDVVRRLVLFGALPDVDWLLVWQDLTEASMGEKIERAYKMADINMKTVQATNEVAFVPDEIRGTVGYDPLEAQITIEEGETE